VPFVGNTVRNIVVTFLVGGNLSGFTEDSLISVATVESINISTSLTFVGGSPVNSNPVVLWVSTEVTCGTGSSTGTGSAVSTTLGTGLGGGVKEVSGSTLIGDSSSGAGEGTSRLGAGLTLSGDQMEVTGTSGTGSTISRTSSTVSTDLGGITLGTNSVLQVRSGVASLTGGDGLSGF